ncbi:cytochrome c [Engelhardtia mirabilis]|uniref:Cbb3-type cytochrome c oxidase subunit CcoP n=1 Tax=Engelhardtia mirabilis TaxID=2528011 RepID=A0A518BNR5_9BACT|nr:Cbb3-type cytochrome c oxidase subunit CcoP [Planctomycetes bacterium Pla133]QDV02941.1 Cbb3-type cytochrome c oxidase subunit CcoP [Planctomycetes bacterium Pla86]
MLPSFRATPSALDPDPFRTEAIALVAVFALVIPAISLGIDLTRPEPHVDPWLQWGQTLGVSMGDLAQGRITFENACSLCHGDDATGVVRLGKPLRNSGFVQGHSDEELFELIVQGRDPSDPANTTGQFMPARAGREDLEEQRLQNVVHYLRTLQEPGVPPVSIEDWIVESSAAGSGAPSAVAGSAGHEVFVASCSACHGLAGEGVPGLGKALANSPFVAEQSDDDLMAFVKTGRPIWDASNTTGVDMPAKGGNPALGDDDLAEIVKYIRSLHGE